MENFTIHISFKEKDLENIDWLTNYYRKKTKQRISKSRLIRIALLYLRRKKEDGN